VEFGYPVYAPGLLVSKDVYIR